MRCNRGGAAIEFALILPVFVILLMTILEYGWLFYHRAALDSAANTGCRAGSLVDPGMGEANMTAVVTRVEDSTDTALTGLGIECGGRCRTSVVAFGTGPARSIRCSLDFQFDPLVGAFLNPRTLESLQVSRLEYQR